ncbi:MAG: hypothetical protein ACXABY_26495, partial [Candidatus Thorarchaeota archaeon]
QQAAGAAQEQAAELARRVEPEIAGLDLGPQSDALRAQIIQGAAAVDRFRAGLVGAEEPLDGFGLGARLLQRSSSGLARVQENAALAQQVVADDLREQAAAIVASTARQLQAGTLTQQQADANAASVQQLLRSTRELDGLSRPIEALKGRTDELAITLGTAARDVISGITGLRGKVLTSAVGKFRDIFEQEGRDIKSTVTRFVNELSAVVTVTASPKQAFKLLEDSLVAAAASTIELADTTRQRAASQRGQASAGLRQDATAELNAAQKEVVETLKRVQQSLRGAGAAAAEFVDGAPFVSLEQGLENVKRSILAALDPGQITFLQGTGVDIDRILEDAVVASGETFKNEFRKESIRVSKILDAEALKGAKAFAQALKESATSTQLLDPDFINDAFSQIGSEFPRLTEQLIEDIVSPLRKQVKRAADSKAKTDSQIDSIRQKQAQAEEETLRRIETSFGSEDLQSSLGASAFSRANEAVGKALLGVFGKLENAIRTDEKSTLESAQIRQQVSKELVATLRASIDAESEIQSNALLVADVLGIQARESSRTQRIIEAENQQLASEISNLTRQIAGAEAFELDDIASLETELASKEQQRLANADDLLSLDREQVRLAAETAQKASQIANREGQILTLEDELVREQANLASATKEAADIARKRNRRAQGGGGERVGGQGPLRDFSTESIKDFGQSLDLRAQAKFVGLLKEENANLRAVNTQLKAHQGNIAKSNNLVDDLTASMTSGQRAAFQFGFAAANAADRLLAWASPAAFIFGAISSLREAVGTIVRLDGEIGRIAFFNSDTLDRISAG